MKIFLGSDHGGYKLKEEIKEYFTGKGYNLCDLGTNSEESVDYPEFGHKVAKEVVTTKDSMGIIICGTGLGISIAANKITNCRAALCHTEEYAKLAREHNNANVLALGGRFTSKENAIKIIDVFLNTSFAGGRHQTRINKIEV